MERATEFIHGDRVEAIAHKGAPHETNGKIGYATCRTIIQGRFLAEGVTPRIVTSRGIYYFDNNLLEMTAKDVR
jgi:hypothetical protein